MITIKLNSIFTVLVIIFHASIAICQEEAIQRTVKNETLHEQAVKFEMKVRAELNEEENEWYERFKQGVMFFDGWNQIAEDILGTFPESIVENKKGLVKRLGIKIGSEWCRDNDIRKIDTQKLKEWGEKIKLAVDRGPEDTEKILREIESEVDRLLEHSNRLSLFTPQS